MPSRLERRAEPELMDDAEEARAYAETDFSDVNAAFVERLLELAGERKAATALDLGTGPGDIPIRLHRLRPDWRLSAVDGSAAMLEHARKAERDAGLDGAIDWVLADAKRTPLAPRSFDVVFSNSILHHITDADRLWAEIGRLGKPGADVFLRDLARPDDEAAASQIVRKYAGNASELLQAEFFRSLLSAYTCDEVRAQLDQAGLAVLEVRMATDRHLDIFGRLP
jgi:ubiquinone/menaquinone biosynthesis C-methylase UbiE